MSMVIHCLTDEKLLFIPAQVILADCFSKATLCLLYFGKCSGVVFLQRSPVDLIGCSNVTSFSQDVLFDVIWWCCLFCALCSTMVGVAAHDNTKFFLDLYKTMICSSGTTKLPVNQSIFPGMNKHLQFCTTLLVMKFDSLTISIGEGKHTFIIT